MEETLKQMEKLCKAIQEFAHRYPSDKWAQSKIAERKRMLRWIFQMRAIELNNSLET